MKFLYSPIKARKLAVYLIHDRGYTFLHNNTSEFIMKENDLLGQTNDLYFVPKKKNKITVL